MWDFRIRSALALMLLADNIALAAAAAHLLQHSSWLHPALGL